MRDWPVSAAASSNWALAQRGRAGFTVELSLQQRAIGRRFKTVLPLHGVAIGRREASKSLKKGARVFVAGKLIQRSWVDKDGGKSQSVEIQVSSVGPDLQFATAEVEKSTAEGLGSSSDGPSAASSAEEKQST